MERTVVIDGKEVTFKSTGALPKLYKMQFQRDFFEDLSELRSYETILNVLRGQGGNLNVFENVAWVLAKTADSSIPDLTRWKNSFENFSIIEVLPDIQDILSLSINAKKSSDNQNQGASDGGINTETYLVLCHECKLSHSDLETMTIGMVLDYIDEYIDSHNTDKKKNEKVIEYADEIAWL